MIYKLRKNYSLSVWLTRICFYVSFIFCNWFFIEGVYNYMSIAGLFSVELERNFLVIAISGLLSAIIAEIFVRLLLKLVLYASKIVMLPRNEFSILFLMCLVPINLIMGGLNLLFYLTPVIISWGSVLFEIVVATPFLILFYAKTKKLYFNDKNSPYYFKVCAIVYLIYFGLKLISLVMEVI